MYRLWSACAPLIGDVIFVISWTARWAEGAWVWYRKRLVSEIRHTLLAEHQALLVRLSNRLSIVYFARAAVSSVVAMVLGLIGANVSTSATETEAWLPLAAFGVAGVFASYVGWCLVRGRMAWLHERQAIDRLRWLRSTLGVDDPSVILP